MQLSSGWESRIAFSLVLFGLSILGNTSSLFLTQVPCEAIHSIEAGE